jgi:alpha-D-xyloside xylohydrolase
LPPYWAFAPWKSRDYHRSEADVFEDIEKTRQLGLPSSVLVLDSPWATNYNTFQLNAKQFADPTAMVSRVHDAGFKLCLWLTPFTNSMTDMPTEPGFDKKIPQAPAGNYAEAAAKGYFVKDDQGKPLQTKWWKGTGALIDFTNPDAKRWWQGQVHQAVLQGADAFKDDAGEGEFVGDAHFSNGEDARLMRTRYTVLYNQAMEEVLQKDLHGDGVLFSRSASTGSQNLPFAWGGDNAEDFHNESGMPTVLRAALSAGLSGISLWASDTGGYVKTQARTADPVLFSRWTEFSAFSPTMEVHSELNIGPWDYGQQALDIYRKYAVLNMSMFPYRYAAAQQSARDGMPIMRALVLEHQDDDMARLAEDEYEFGPDFLVAPVITAGTQRTVYIPDGLWRDAWTGKLVPTRHVLTVDAALDQLPLYVRDGAVIPKIPEDVMTLVPAAQVKIPGVPALDDRRVYELYPALMESGGMVTTDFEGRQLIRSVRADGGRLLIDGKAAQMEVRWKFAAPQDVMVNGKSVAVQSGEHSAYIRFPHATHSEITWNLPAAPMVSGEAPDVPVSRLRLPPWSKRYAQKREEAKAGNADLVFLGDSITERYESGDYRAIWEYYTKDRHPLNLGFSGDTTGNLLWRITQGGELDGLHPKTAVLLIGTNSTSEKHPDWDAEMNAQAIEKVVAETRSRLPKTHILVLSILPAGKGQEKENLDDHINAMLAKQYAAGSVAGVEFVDVSSVFRHSGQLRSCLYADPRSKPPEGAVHPTPLGQADLAAALEPALAKAMGDQPRPPMNFQDPLCP